MILISFVLSFRHRFPPFQFGFAGIEFEIVGFICVLFGTALTLALTALGNSRLHGLVIQTVRLEYQPFGHKNFGLDPCPQQLLGRHAMVADEAAGRKRRSAQDAHPAHLLGANDGPQAKIKAHRRAERQQ